MHNRFKKYRKLRICSFLHHSLLVCSCSKSSILLGALGMGLAYEKQPASSVKWGKSFVNGVWVSSAISSGARISYTLPGHNRKSGAALTSKELKRGVALLWAEAPGEAESTVSIAPDPWIPRRVLADILSQVKPLLQVLFYAVNAFYSSYVL